MTCVFGIVAKSGSGKTTLIETLIPLFKGRGVSVSTIKHTHHAFDMDKPGKDSWRHREAGALEVVLASKSRFALLHELRDETEPEIEDLLKQMSQVDLVLVEGFKRHPHPKIEIYRPSLGKDALWPHDPHIRAVASDVAIADCPLPVLDLNNPEAIMEFVLAFVSGEMSA